jgi:hypothetical protein
VQTRHYSLKLVKQSFFSCFIRFHVHGYLYDIKQLLESTKNDKTKQLNIKGNIYEKESSEFDEFSDYIVRIVYNRERERTTGHKNIITYTIETSDAASV